MVEDEETGRKLCIPISSDSENPGCRRESRYTRSFWKRQKKCLGKHLEKEHRVRNLVVERRNPESSGHTESNFQADPDDK